MSSKMCCVERPEFFLDRSLRRRTAITLRSASHLVHLIADHYPNDADDVLDEDWITEGCANGWVLLTKDKRIRYRAAELAALRGDHLFCVASGNLTVDDMSSALLRAIPRIERVARDEPEGFWHVYRDGQLARMWP
ncbi:MAG: hypothetical protein ACRCYX_09715 [Dermatophilaceae bacterium]